ncbi:MAG: iron chelate uptake ABC transporter family permease subunit [Turicibacter sp.]|jgi:iron complex transport system permease protein|uniref:ABC transporter permease protein YclO n=1 Tax=Turicibacter faecis TaxID=2963365 RepID=A0ABN6ZLS4_9FIRM|nr:MULTISPECIES: iron chelate uptake ABC transporter family permease subunit [unclassified Turicibacter]MCI8702363.1 iron chelate uptake ABC transporter family permease subunit [Turicibacter sp.]MCU7205390.1 iron chelate uptake ABC transporter family permease subunit [Turicibacter sp. TA25]MCU7209289.1 iron chelate uptake ABC transporter family permease subunit [Turicibacter sp. 1E2]BEH91878.1 putative ABC transporter permease protein YclO [Turicibacter sp. TC023]
MRRHKVLIILIVLVVVSSFLFLMYGLNPNSYQYALSLRVPKLIAIALTGSGIALSSVIFQTVTNNRILTPSVLGLDSLYNLFQTLIVFVFGSLNIALAGSNINFLFSAALMIIFSLFLFKMMFKREGTNLFFLLMVGMVFGTLFSSLSSFMQMVMDPNEFLIVQNKMFASFNNVQSSLLMISIIIVSVAIGCICKDFKKLDVMSLGKEQAVNLGINYDYMVKKILIIVSILVSVSTALVGPITFLGILVTNLAYQLVKDYRHSVIVPTAILLSLAALIGGQFLVERVFHFSTTVGVIINFIGGLYFIYILLKEERA